MLTNLFFAFLGIGAFFLLPVAERYKKFLSFAFVIVLAGFFYQVFQNYDTQIFDSFSFAWMQSPKYKIDINIDSTQQNYIIFLPILLISIFMTLQIIFYSKEDKKNREYSIIAFNLANIILLISSRNLVQLLTGICIADIITQLMINNFYISKKYIFYSLFANFGLFMIFAMIQGKLKSFDLNTVSAYQTIGRHKDFVGIATLLFVFLKMELFMFHSALLKLKNINSYKLIFAFLLSGIFAGFFLLTKIYDLLKISEFSVPILYYVLAINAAFGLINGMIIAGNNKRLMYFNMLLYSLLIYLFMQYQKYDVCFSIIMVLAYLSFVTFIVTHKYLKLLGKLLCVILWSFVFYKFKLYEDYVSLIAGCCILIFLLFSGKIHYFYRFQLLQNLEIFDKIYEFLFIKPILTLGRGLWLLVDFMIMEKHVSNSMSIIENVSEKYIAKIQDNRLVFRLLLLALAILLFMSSFYCMGIGL